MEALYFEFVPALVAIVLTEWNHKGNFGRGPYKEHLCEIILNLGQQFQRCLKILFWPFWMAEWNCLGNIRGGP